MAFDGIVTAAAAAEFKKLLIGGRVEKIHQPDSEEIVFHIRSSGQKYKLLISVNSANPRICLIDEQDSNPQNPPAFCMLLRKHLMMSRIKNIEQYSSERIIEFSFDSVDELGFMVNKVLILEIMGKHSNLILTELPSFKILDSIKHISLDVNRYRQTLPGLTYIYPPAHDKVSFRELSENEFYRAVGIHTVNEGNNIPGNYPNTIQDAPIRIEIREPDAKSVVAGIQGISPLVAAEICSSHKGSYACFRDIIDRVLSGDYYPAVYYDQDGKLIDFHVVKMDITDNYPDCKIFGSVNEAIVFYYSHKAASNRVHQKAHSLIRAVSTLLDKQYLKKQRLSEDIQKAQNSDIYRLYGELLTSNLHNIKEAQSSVSLFNYYDGTEIQIPMDKLLTSVQNAQRYYKRYSKAKTAVIEKTRQFEETQKEIDYLESVMINIENSGAAENIDEIRAELISNRYIRKRKTSGKPQKPKLKPYEFRTRDGMRVLVGRNNIENDTLTLKTASSRDLWLHTKDIPGSHVILFTDGAEVIPEDSIREAASLAAYYSKARLSSNVPVDYVRIKYVKKPAGAKPGMVIFTNNRTIYSEPCVPEGVEVIRQ